jgi:sugar phosphate isomerase/epimerase
MLENQLAIASVSLGQHSSHTLPLKIRAAAESGFSGLEITYPDLESYAATLSCPILDAAQQVSDLCKALGILVIALVSFQNFEGNKSSLGKRLKEAARWLTIARTMKAEYLQVPSTYDRDINNDHEVIVSELRQLSDLASASKPVIKIAYENLAWSTHCTLWQDALVIVQEVNRDNFGLCLDSFHLSTALWADPFNLSGRQPHGKEGLEASLHAFVKDCPLDKIFYIQLSDGELMDPPYSEDHPWYDPKLEVGHVWSNEARPFPLETEYGAYMPVQEIAQAFLVDKGFSGWVSLETFDRRMREEVNDPIQNARRGIKAWQHLKSKLLAAQNAG